MKIAIIGFGPRGLACLENVVYEFSNSAIKELPQILIFETSNALGTGKAWEIDQPDTNYINISDHALQNLKGREKTIFGAVAIPSFPSYTQWCLANDKEENMDGDKDVYPARSQMGSYLNERANSICDVLLKNNVLEIYKEYVDAITYDLGNVTIQTKTVSIKVAECLLSIGHTPTIDSEETKKFKEHAEQNQVIYIHNPYEEYIARGDMANIHVAIKGFGLSMLDITRQLTNYKFGVFEKKKDSKYLNFVAKKGCVQKIIPYSFDGLPCVPKPYGRKVDTTFEPSVYQKNAFELALRNHLSQPKKIKNIDFVLDAFATVATTIFLNNTAKNYDEIEISEVIKKWLQDTSIAHDLILDTKMSTVVYMKKTVAMAWGEVEPSLDFHIGQVWRHLQPTMYRLFAFSGMSARLMKELIAIDQETKRYSYGPPVESILQLIALSEASILELDFVNDPKIETVKDGWKFSKNGNEITAEMLCNSVMDGPVLEKFDNSLFQKLLESKLIQPVHEDLGVLTNADGTLIAPNNENTQVPIAVVGRNAKGCVLGTDAILECFSPETHDWARGVVARFVK